MIARSINQCSYFTWTIPRILYYNIYDNQVLGNGYGLTYYKSLKRQCRLSENILINLYKGA